jgi:glutamate dehydrogenase
MLVEMTDDVAKFVLRNNYLQTQAISMMEAQARDRLDEAARLVVNLEKTGLLDRYLEFLPDEAEIEERRQRKLGFTRPEIAVILSYAKIDLYNGLTCSEHALEDFLTTDPQRYFPPLLRKKYLDLIPGHRLSRQILTTLISNNIVNRMGPTFVQRVQQDTGADVVTIARAYVVAREVCQASDIWHTIEALDNRLPATAQQTMMFEVSRILRHACYWLIDRYGDDLDIVETVEYLKSGMATVYARVYSFVSPVAKERLKKITEEQIRLGAPEKLARKMSGLLLSRGGLDIVDLAKIHKKDTVETAKLYSDLSDRLGFIWLNRCVEDLEVEGRWHAIARSNLRDELYLLRRELAGTLLSRRSKKSPVETFAAWLETNASAVRQFDAVLAEMKLRPESDFAVLSVAAQQIRKLISQ